MDALLALDGNMKTWLAFGAGFVVATAVMFLFLDHQIVVIMRSYAFVL